MTTKVVCMLEAYHKQEFLEFPPQPWDTPEAMERFKEMDRLRKEAHIVNFMISEAQAQKIVRRLWPNQSLLHATGGQGFPIETADQAV